MTDITTQFPLPWSVGSYGFDIKASNGLHVDEICSASDEDGDKQLAAMICHAVNNHDALVRALKDVLADIEEYERANNLAPNPGRTRCWDSVARARKILEAFSSDGSEAAGGAMEPSGLTETALKCQPPRSEGETTRSAGVAPSPSDAVFRDLERFTEACNKLHGAAQRIGATLERQRDPFVAPMRKCPSCGFWGKSPLFAEFGQPLIHNEPASSPASAHSL